MFRGMSRSRHIGRCKARAPPHSRWCSIARSRASGLLRIGTRRPRKSHLAPVTRRNLPRRTGSGEPPSSRMFLRLPHNLQFRSQKDSHKKTSRDSAVFGRPRMKAPHHSWAANLQVRAPHTIRMRTRDHLHKRGHCDTRRPGLRRVHLENGCLGKRCSEKPARQACRFSAANARKPVCTAPATWWGLYHAPGESPIRDLAIPHARLSDGRDSARVLW